MTKSARGLCEKKSKIIVNLLKKERTIQKKINWVDGDYKQDDYIKNHISYYIRDIKLLKLECKQKNFIYDFDEIF